MSVPRDGTGPGRGTRGYRRAREGDPWDDPRLPWHGKPRAADILAAGHRAQRLLYWSCCRCGCRWSARTRWWLNC